MYSIFDRYLCSVSYALVLVSPLTILTMAAGHTFSTLCQLYDGNQG